jgi:peptidoglycan/xylan/chitin deacetylase (PgdA/CDA1 family)
MPTDNLSAIVTYHSLDRSGSVISTTQDTFRRHLDTLRAAHIPISPLSEIHNRPGSVAITFDDGFENFRESALPLLIEYGIPATVFVVTGYCGCDNRWPSQSASAPRLPLMDWSGLKEVSAAGYEIGAHTVTHPDLTKLSAQKVDQELLESRDRIEQQIGCTVRSFAFPYGCLNDRITQRAAKYFGRACGTRLDYVTPASNALQLPRIDAYYLRDPRHFKTLLTAGGQNRIAIRRWLREARAWASR